LPPNRDSPLRRSAETRRFRAPFGRAGIRPFATIAICSAFDRPRPKAEVSIPHLSGLLSAQSGSSDRQRGARPTLKGKLSSWLRLRKFPCPIEDFGPRTV
jgi:hypothetical protein